jgi:hypothetical protein
MSAPVAHGLAAWLGAPRHGWELIAFITVAVILGGIALGLLASIPAKYRKGVVMGVTFLAGLYYSIEFLIPPAVWPIRPPRNPLSDWRPFVGLAAQIVGSFALLLGVSNLFQIHQRAVAKRTPGWYNSAAFFIAFFAIVLAGFLKGSHDERVAGQIYNILFRGFLTSLDSTMFSLIAFYIVSAAYRAFRIRSTEAALMMVAAAIIMLALVPVGAAITNWLPTSGWLSAFRLERIGYWLLIGPNMAAQRAIAFGIAVGSMAMGLRIWLSLERGSFFDRQL